jgi:sulfatase modifying factor 1
LRARVKKMTTRRWAAWAAALSTTVVGCGTLLGYDKDYVPVDDGAAAGAGGAGSGTSGASGASSASGAGQDCKLGDKRCSGNTPQSCDDKGRWQTGTACSGKAELCVLGACTAPPPSCAKLASTCGLKQEESCCTLTEVPSGTYNRSNDPTAPATVSGYLLDRFEVTVGRFRAFVEAYPGSKPKAGAGAHPLIVNSGWDTAWNADLPADATALRAAVVKCDSPVSEPCIPTWTNTPGENEHLPMNSISWYEAFAFCAWDGGRLTTEAEWNHASAGGSEQRPYPWGSAALDGEHVGYDCTADGSASQQCAITDILPVGARPAGDGRFGQADLAGGMFEWNLDGYSNTYPLPCIDCAGVNGLCSDCSTQGIFQVARGGSWASAASYLLSSNRSKSNVDTNRLFGTASKRFDYIGVRCARIP